MHKIFKEYSEETDNIESYFEEYNAYANCIIEYAKSYIGIATFDSEIIEEILLNIINDPINNIMGIPFKKGDIYKVRKIIEIDSNKLINKLYNSCALELLNNHTDEININLRMKILLDFLNYVTKLNGYNKIFTIKDLINKAEREKYLSELELLKYFLEDTCKYTKSIKKGIDVEQIINKELSRYNVDLENITINELKNNKVLEYVIETIIYAYEKSSFFKKKEIKNELIKQKLMQMKKR